MRVEGVLHEAVKPRARKPIRKNLPRSVDHLTSLGVPVCAAGFPFDFLGCRHAEGRFLFQAPEDEVGAPVYTGCSRARSSSRVRSRGW